MGDTTIRNFSMSYGELIGTCSGVYGFMQRDASEFLLYGVSNTAISDFNDVLQDFINLPQDQELEAIEKNKTFVKNEIANELRIMLRTYTMRAKLVFGENDGHYNRFYKKDMNKLNDRDLELFARMVRDSATEYLTQLSTVGLTQAMIDDLSALITSFYDAMYDQSLASANRDNASKARVEKANELYELLTRYCDIGKTIWYETNEALYNDYVIYQSSSPGSLDAPANLVFNYSSKVLWWDVVDNATSYQLQWWNGTDYEEIYTGSDINFSFTPPDGLNKFRVRAHNAGGYGPWSDELQQYYFAVLPKAANLQIVQSGTIPTEGELTWDAVPTAFNYKVYQSVDNIGEYAAHWLVIGTVTEPLKSVTLTLGKRNSFRVETNNTYQTSMSDVVFIEV